MLAMATVEGLWACQSAILFGVSTDKNVISSMTLELADGRYRATREGMLVYEATYTLDETTNPKSITIVPLEKKHKRMAMLGIYELDGPTFTLCLSIDGRRPRSFTSNLASLWTLRLGFANRTAAEPGRPICTRNQTPTLSQFGRRESNQTAT